MSETSSFSWQGKRVFLTGHTGFKGGWLALWLVSKGAIVRGYALDPSTEPNLFMAAKVGSVIEDIRGDIRDSSKLEPALRDFAPEVVFHLAAQPLVRYSYEDPIGTYETNVIGTARVLDAVRRTPAFAPSSASPQTSATRTKSGSGAIARPIPSAATILTPAPRPAPRSYRRPIARATSPSRSLPSTSAPSPLAAPATSSAEATGRSTG